MERNVLNWISFFYCYKRWINDSDLLHSNAPVAKSTSILLRANSLIKIELALEIELSKELCPTSNTL